ncbi:FAD-dependent oxidoreductase [Patulibacter sp. SYSU D01012]|uniref:NAD(P)/FAD-dependent oxidoreductase n=1 Tax=Patulibacter sp. SYSU D01012 TaxID=2817381 RepID=UPI001B308D11|nr:FAD-dependent oxidoreductase [Patulibacter sp. SYSU D01012]
MRERRPDVLIVGGGPAGLTAAADLRAAGVRDVLLVERETELGGVPRHCHHQGFGLRDLHRPLSGPAYAARVRERAVASGAELRTGAMVTGWDPDATGPVPAALLTSPAGRERVQPRAIVLATGVRERPRSARRLAGVRAPGGVLTTGTLQQQVYLEGMRLPGRTVVVGAEHVSYSALSTLRHAGSRPVAMVTELPGHETWGPIAFGGRAVFGVPLRTGVRVRRILGVDRVVGVELEHVADGRTETIACERVLLTGDWIPDHELAVSGGIVLDRATRGPRVDQALRTARPGVFAAGNALHPAETADVAALDGRHVAGPVSAWLSAGASSTDWPVAPVAIQLDSPLRWIAPNVLVPGAGLPPRERFALRADAQARRVRVTVTQDDRTLWTGRLAHLGPARCSTLPADWVPRVRPDGGPVRVRVDR